MDMDIRLRYIHAMSTQYRFLSLHSKLSFNMGDQLQFVFMVHPSTGTAHVDKRYVTLTIMTCSIINDIYKAIN